MRWAEMITQDDSVPVNEPCAIIRIMTFTKKGFYLCLPAQLLHLQTVTSWKPTNPFVLKHLNSASSSGTEPLCVSKAAVL